MISTDDKKERRKFYTDADGTKRIVAGKNPIYLLTLHEITQIGNNTSAMRVPGGWIYTQIISNAHNTQSVTSEFVPFSAEFREDI